MYLKVPPWAGVGHSSSDAIWDTYGTYQRPSDSAYVSFLPEHVPGDSRCLVSVVQAFVGI